MKKYYVYLHRRATDGSVFYVGKGCGDRAGARNPRNKHWHRIVNKNGFRYEIIKRFDTEEEALLWEKAIISHYGLENLSNMTVGGDGKSGCYYKPIYCSNGMYFKGVSLASKWLNKNGWPKADTTHLTDCANGKRNSAYGLVWCFKGVPSGDFKTREEINGERSRKTVYCSNGMVFDGVTSAKKWLESIGHKNPGHSCISVSARRPGSTSYGFSWSYESVPTMGLTRDKKNEIKQGQPVLCSNGMKFHSVESAVRWLREDQGSGHGWSIRKHQGTGRVYKGYTWKFIEKGL